MLSRSNISWPTVLFVTLLILAAVQFIRVNRPAPKSERVQASYTADGPLLTGTVAIAADSFHSVRIDLNRSANLKGYFRTANLKIRVEALVLEEEELESWKSGLEHETVARTGRIPGGRFNLRLQPGTYFLVLDNRGSAEPAAPVAVQYNID